MSIKSILSTFSRWLLRRLQERSTYAGIATIAGVVGAQAIGAQISQVGDAVALITGTGLIAATTSAHPPIEELVGALR